MSVWRRALEKCETWENRRQEERESRRRRLRSWEESRRRQLGGIKVEPESWRRWRRLVYVYLGGGERHPGPRVTVWAASSADPSSSGRLPVPAAEPRSRPPRRSEDLTCDQRACCTATTEFGGRCPFPGQKRCSCGCHKRIDLWPEGLLRRNPFRRTMPLSTCAHCSSRMMRTPPLCLVRAAGRATLLVAAVAMARYQGCNVIM